MKGRSEQLFYVTVGVGMALATSGFTMISGLFALASTTWIVIGIVMSGGLCTVIALSIGELASMYPSAPGVRTYFKVAFGDKSSLMMTYLYLIFVVLIAGMESFVFSQVVSAVFPGANVPVTVLLLLVLVVTVNLMGFELPRSLQIISTILAVLLIVVSGILGLIQPRVGLHLVFSLADAPRQLAILPGLIGMSIFLFTGFEWVTPLGLRPKSYKRAIPLSMPVAVITLCITYILFVCGAASQLPVTTIAATPIPQIAYFSNLYGSHGPDVALLLSAVAIFSTFNAGIMGGSKLIFMLAHEGKLPKWVLTMAPQTGAPIGAILLLGGFATISALVVLTFRLEMLAALLGASIMCFIYAAFMLSAIRLRRAAAPAAGEFRSPVPILIQWLLFAVLLMLGIMTLLSEPGLRLMACVGAAISLLLAYLLVMQFQPRRTRAVKTADSP